MDRLFFDTNVLLDVLEKRPPWFPDSAECLSHVRRGRAQGAITGLSLSDISYIQKSTPAATLAEIFTRLRDFLDVAPIDGQIVDVALALRLPDLEDGFQLAAALHWGATHFLTRNRKDFPENARVIIQEPAAYLRSGR